LQQNSVVRRLRVVKARGLALAPGRHAFRITEEGLHVYPRLLPLVESVRQRKGPRAAFGIDTLDEMMRGGVPRGQTCIVAGSAGTGKTLLALHFAVAGAAAGEPSVMVTFEESPAEHAEKMAAFGWNLANLERRGLMEMLHLRPVDLSVDEVINGIAEAVAHRKARRVIINSISGMEIALAQSERPELREGLCRLTEHLTSRGLVVLLATEVPDLLGEPRISTEGLSFIADNIIVLRYVEISSELRRVLSVVKMRTSAHDNLLREYRIGKKGITIEESYKGYSGILTGVPTLLAAGTAPPPRRPRR
jgi:circadian clock protein KaiC